MPDNDDIRAALQGLTADEPPLGFGAGEVVASGRRRQSRRHGMVAGVASIAAAIAVTVPLTLLGGQHVAGAGSGGTTAVPPIPSPRSATTTPPAPVPARTAPPSCDVTPTLPSYLPTESPASTETPPAPYSVAPPQAMTTIPSTPASTRPPVEGGGPVGTVMHAPSHVQPPPEQPTLTKSPQPALPSCVTGGE
jgi:hypothetical protein